ncbi:hypothetical protein DC20_05130 [Rufibacter tibetensis]|uniref:Uncharacterized protein n=1 Tax=Rufibacter tibetensis TaxID=512763 RepID=A0A0P0C5E9_9BACT|nr:hypothetical protein DC20_05130 [Rufibacter tibetensis]
MISFGVFSEKQVKNERNLSAEATLERMLKGENLVTSIAGASVPLVSARIAVYSYLFVILKGSWERTEISHALLSF